MVALDQNDCSCARWLSSTSGLFTIASWLPRFHVVILPQDDWPRPRQLSNCKIVVPVQDGWSWRIWAGKLGKTMSDYNIIEIKQIQRIDVNANWDTVCLKFENINRIKQLFLSITHWRQRAQHSVKERVYVKQTLLKLMYVGWKHFSVIFWLSQRVGSVIHPLSKSIPTHIIQGLSVLSHALSLYYVSRKPPLMYTCMYGTRPLRFHGFYCTRRRLSRCWYHSVIQIFLALKDLRGTLFDRILLQSIGKISWIIAVLRELISASRGALVRN